MLPVPPPTSVRASRPLATAPVHKWSGVLARVRCDRFRCHTAEYEYRVTRMSIAVVFVCARLEHPARIIVSDLHDSTLVVFGSDRGSL
jgi:hypothetical protein